MPQPSKNIDVIERDSSIVLVDENGDAYTFSHIEGEHKLIENTDAPEEILRFIKEETEYSFEPDVKFPFSVKTSHHLEDTVGLKLSRELQMPLEELIGQHSIDYPSMEVHENWEVKEDGCVRLKSIKYNGQKFTPE